MYKCIDCFVVQQALWQTCTAGKGPRETASASQMSLEEFSQDLNGLSIAASRYVVSDAFVEVEKLTTPIAAHGLMHVSPQAGLVVSERRRNDKVGDLLTGSPRRDRVEDRQAARLDRL